jgi:fermentation-respiration switch protein FrsA (DUF1100 family)
MLKIVFYTLGIYAILLMALYWFQRNLIYFPDRSIRTPIEAGVPEMKVIDLKTQDGLLIKAWYSQPSTTNSPTIVYFHGNAGHISDRAFVARAYMQKGYGILLVTYRGYSGNPGTPSEQGFYNDARAAMNFLEHKQIPLNCTILLGESIGSAVAIKMATEYTVGAIALQAPFSSLIDVATIHYALFMPIKGLIKDKFDSSAIAGQILAPVLIIHGKSDTIVPPELSRKLLSLLPEPKEAQYIPNKGHNDLFEPDLVDTFIRRYVACK